MHTEGEIRKAVKLLVEKYGRLTTSEVKKLMSEVLPYDKEDKIKSTARGGEIKILQRIGNIASHQKEKKKYYPEGFFVEKDAILLNKKTQAAFSSVIGLSKEIREIAPSEIKKRKTLGEKSRSGGYKKIDWNSLNERRTEIGLKGERFVYEMEKENAEKIEKGLSSRVQHLSEMQGDWFGYDILSVDEKGNSIYIEVKTTTYGQNTPFYMSVNELEFFKQRKKESSAFLYRVYNFDKKSEHGLIKKITAAELFTMYKSDPISFLVTKK